MKRPKKQDPPTTINIVDAATALFYGRGLRAVSLDDIAAAANLTKRTIYYHFPTKDDLILAYLRRWREQTRAAFESDGALPPRRRLAAAFDRLEREVRHPKFRGCPFVNAVAEINDRRHPVTRLAFGYKEDRRMWFESTARDASVRHAEATAEQLMLLWEGAISRALIVGTSAGVVEARRAGLQLLA